MFGPGLAIKQLVGSDVLFAALILPLAAPGQLTMGNVDIATVLTLLVGSIPGVLIGTRLATHSGPVQPAGCVVVMVPAGSRLL